MYTPTKRKKLEMNRQDLRNKVCCVAMLEGVVEDGNALHEIEDGLKKKVKRELTCKSSRFGEQMIQEMSNAFDTHSNGTSRANRLRGREGVDRAPLLNREVPFKELWPMIKFKAAVMLEIQARGIELVTDKDKTWWGILRLIKTHEGSDVAFRPVTPFENFAWC